MSDASKVPVIGRVDWVVVGGCSSGVAAAVALAEAGQSVMMVAPRSYVGEDIAGAFRFWDSAEEGRDLPLAVELFGAGKQPTPMQVKLTLERALLDAGVRLVLTTSPADVLRDDSGRVAGVVVANRAGRQAVVAGGVIDASWNGTLSSLGGHAVRRPRGNQRVSHITLCHDEGTDALGIDVERLPGFEGTIDDTPYRISARRYELEVDFGDGSPDAFARAQAEVSTRCWVPMQYLQQELVELVEPGDADRLARCSAEDVELEPGLITLSPHGGTQPAIAQQMRSPVASINLGRHLGAALAWRYAGAPEGSERLQAGAVSLKSVERGEIRSLSDPLRPASGDVDALLIGADALPRLGRYDVLVLGGGTAGTPAAIAAAQAGATVGLIEAGPALGGVGTLGQITKYWFGNREGFTKTVDEGVRSLEFREKFHKADGMWSVAAKQAWYQQRCHKLGVAIWLGTQGVGVWIEDDSVLGVVVVGPQGYGLIEASAVIDSTGCADLPAAAGAETVTLGADHVAVQGTGLAGLTPSRDYHNSDHNFCDDTDVTDTTTFFITSRRKFANHFDLGQLVDSRERRQIVGQLSLDPVDILYNRRFPDTICVATSNFDSHGFTTHPVFMLKAPDKKPLWADVPFRCLVPRGLRGLLVTGLAVSAHRDALPVIRMQADVQNQGYAAGYAAAMACRTGRDVTEVDVRELQGHLVDIGALPERVLTDADSFPVDEVTLHRAVADEGESPAGLALLFADQARSLPLLREAFVTSMHKPSRQQLALLLALMGDDTGEAVLLEQVSQASWDKGWNYRGMGQFGRSLSPVDVMVIGLGQVGGEGAWSVLLDRARDLRNRAVERGELPEFSHCRALAMAFETMSARIAQPYAAQSLVELLDLPDASGHAQQSLADAFAALTDDTNENEVRNRALRELHLARAIFRCGDDDGVGQATLDAYARDVRGHFAKHASAVLAEKRASRYAQPTQKLAAAAK